MKASAAFKKFFSLQRFRKITLFILIFLVCFASYLALAHYEPWRFLTTAHPHDFILPKEPQDYPNFLIIEAPELEVKNYRKELHYDLPYLYVDLPADLPKEIIEYLDLRNSLIQEVYDKHYSLDDNQPDDFYPEEIKPGKSLGGDFIPFIYKGQTCFFALSWNQITLYDTSLNKLHEIKEDRFSYITIVSARFQDRFWKSCLYGGAVLGSFYFLEVTSQDEIKTSKIHHGDYGDFDIDPYNTLKIKNMHTNPQMKVHISGHKGYLYYPIVYLFVFFPLAYIFLMLLADVIIHYLIIAILGLFLLLIAINIAQKNNMKNQKLANNQSEAKP